MAFAQEGLSLAELHGAVGVGAGSGAMRAAVRLKREGHLTRGPDGAAAGGGSGGTGGGTRGSDGVRDRLRLSRASDVLIGSWLLCDYALMHQHVAAMEEMRRGGGAQRA